MHFSRRDILLASAISAIGSSEATADTVSLVIKVELSSDRDQTGTLRLQTGAGATLAGPLSVYGRSDNSKAAAHGNPSRDPTKPYGDTPTGTYQIPQAVATGDSTSYVSHSYGPNGALVLKPKTGEAAAAVSNGRVGLLIHGGDPGTAGKLRATAASDYRIRTWRSLWRQFSPPEKMCNLIVAI